MGARARYGFVVAAVLVAVLPLLLSNGYYQSVLVFIGINAIVALGLNLLMGYAGQISLGHAAFHAMGAYASGILTATYHVNPWLAMACSVVFASAVALVVGVPTLKLSGHYLAIATLGVGMIVSIVLVQWVSLTGGTSGLTDIPTLSVAGFPLNSDLRYYYLVWGVCLLLTLLSINLVNSRFGRALRAIHVSEVAAATCGVNVARLKLQVFVLSAAYAGLAGSLYAHYVHFISPERRFGFPFSIEAVVMVVLGGLGNIWGSLLGSGTVTALGEFLRQFGDYDVAAFGLILMLAMIFLPQGISGGLARITLRRRPAPTPAAPPQEVAHR
jgi:branched-chain amino acid transport system permease protein